MIKIILTIILIFSSICLAKTEYWFESLINSKKIHIADKNIHGMLKKITIEDYNDCKNQLQLSEYEMKQYFYSIPIQLAKTTDTFLILPSKYCYAFYGAHSIQFWILKMTNESSYDFILSGRQDGIEILGNSTNGYANIKSYYGIDEHLYIYDGKEYKEDIKQ